MIDSPPPPDARYTVRDAEIEAVLRGIASRIAGGLPPGWGFALFLYQFGEHGNAFYIANGERTDMIKMLQEWIARQTML